MFMEEDGWPVAELQPESNTLSAKAEQKRNEFRFMTSRMTTNSCLLFKVQQKRGTCPFPVQFFKLRGI